mgnify:CR=1
PEAAQDEASDEVYSAGFRLHCFAP